MVLVRRRRAGATCIEDARGARSEVGRLKDAARGRRGVARRWSRAERADAGVVVLRCAAYPRVDGFVTHGAGLYKCLVSHIYIFIGRNTVALNLRYVELIHVTRFFGGITCLRQKALLLVLGPVGALTILRTVSSDAATTAYEIARLGKFGLLVAGAAATTRGRPH